MTQRKKNLYFGLGPAPTPSKRERRRQRTEFQAGVKRKRTALKRGREKESATLFKQLQRDAKPQRARRAKWTPQDEEAWKQMLRENPMRQFPGDLTATEISALRKLARLKTMSSKKKRRRKKKNPKGVMPPGLKRWHAEQKRKKAKKKNPRKRKAKAMRRRPRRTPRRKPVSTRVRNYRKPARRKRKQNPRPRRVKVIKTNLRKGTKAFRQFVSATRAKYGSARVL